MRERERKETKEGERGKIKMKEEEERGKRKEERGKRKEESICLFCILGLLL